jgi:predicted transcriptional regulator
MQAIDFRNATYESVKEQVLTAEKRWRVYSSLLNDGPGTTRQVAARLEVEVHAIRPRFTELYQSGFIDLVPDQVVTKEGGVYFARTAEEFSEWLAARPERAVSGQQVLKI